MKLSSRYVAFGILGVNDPKTAATASTTTMMMMNPTTRSTRSITTTITRLHSSSSSSSSSSTRNLWFKSSPLLSSSALSRLHFSVSAYSGIPSDGRSGTEVLQLPLRARLPMPITAIHTSTDSTATTAPKTRLVEIDVFRTDDEIEQGRQLMNYVIEEGRAWPFEEVFEASESFRGYFLSHAAFCVRPVSEVSETENGEDEDTRSIDDTNNDSNKILGCFYIKPNFPGRCSHICNGGFIVDVTQRGWKVGSLMGSAFLPFAKSLGYKSSYFNLVFASNVASIKLWNKLDMKCVATIPNAARLNGMPVINPTTNETQLDIAYGYYYDLDELPDDYDPLRHPNLPDFSP